MVVFIDLWQKILEFTITHFTFASSALAVLVGIVGAIVWGRRFGASFAKATHIHRASFYSELDRIYFDLLRMAIEYPHLRAVEPVSSGKDKMLNGEYDPYPSDPFNTEEEKAAKGKKLAQYDAYAFMVWNFIETLHDRCQDYEDLLDTWATVVAAENQLHRGWFLQQMALDYQRCAQDDYEPCEKFCKPFQVFIYDKNFTPVNGSYPNWPYKGRGKFKAPLVFAERSPHIIAESRGKNEMRLRRGNAESHDRSIPL